MLKNFSPSSFFKNTNQFDRIQDDKLLGGIRKAFLFLFLDIFCLVAVLDMSELRDVSISTLDMSYKKKIGTNFKILEN